MRDRSTTTKGERRGDRGKEGDGKGRMSICYTRLRHMEKKDKLKEITRPNYNVIIVNMSTSTRRGYKNLTRADICM